MSRWPTLVTALLVVAAAPQGIGQASGSIPPPGGSRAGPGVSVRLVTESDEVDFGRAFHLNVVRSWTTDLVPERWDDDALAPLVVRLDHVARRESAERVEETRHFRAYAFLPDALTVPEIIFTARSTPGGPAFRARTRARELRVRSALESESPGAPELPGDLLPPPKRGPWRPIVAIALGALVLLGGAGLWLRRSRAATMSSRVAPDAVALGSIRGLRERDLQDPGDLASGCGQVAALLRCYLRGRFALGAEEMTSEEIGAAMRARDLLPSSERERLEDLLAVCDRGQFGPLPPTPGEMETLLEQSESFVLATHSGSAEVARGAVA
jgi:hypothetical protein